MVKVPRYYHVVKSRGGGGAYRLVHGLYGLIRSNLNFVRLLHISKRSKYMYNNWSNSRFFKQYILYSLQNQQTKLINSFIVVLFLLQIILFGKLH